MSLEGTCPPPPQEGVVSISSSERLLTSLSVLCVTKCPFYICSDDSLSPHLISRYGCTDPQTFSDGEILKCLTLSVSCVLEEAASEYDKKYRNYHR